MKYLQLIRITILISVLLYCSPIFGNPEIIEAGETLWQSPASIENIEFTVHPMGTFFDVEISMDIFCRNYDKAMVYVDFELPINSIVYESFYERSEKMQKAQLRNRIGSISDYNDRSNSYFKFKQIDDKQYKITMYPLKRKSRRTIQFKYLEPAKFSNNKCIINIPSFLTGTNTIDSEIKINLYQTERYMLSAETLNQYKHGTPDAFQLIKANVTKDQFSSASFSYNDTNYEQSLSVFSTQMDNFYQLIISPDKIIDKDTSKNKTCILFDYSPNTSVESKNNIINELLNNAQTFIESIDSFNIIYSATIPYSISEKWMACNKTNIEQFIKEENVTSVTNTLALIKEGLNFIARNGGQGDLFLLSNSGIYWGAYPSLIEQIKKLNINNNAINIIDYSTQAISVFIEGENRFYNSSYFFESLATSTGGIFKQVSTWNFRNIEAFSSLLKLALENFFFNELTNIEIKPSDSNLTLYERYQFSSACKDYFIKSTPIIQLGLYENNLPSSFQITFDYLGETYNKTINFSDSEIEYDQNSLEMIWQGLDQKRLEQTQQRDQIDEIIERNMAYSILGKYTAFMNFDVPEIVNIESWQLDIPSEKSENTIKTFPNPFNNYLEIDLSFTKETIYDVKIIDLNGHLVKNIYTINNQRKYIWNCYSENNLPIKSGIYFVVVRFRNSQEVLKIVKF